MQSYLFSYLISLIEILADVLKGMLLGMVLIKESKNFASYVFPCSVD